MKVRIDKRFAINIFCIGLLFNRIILGRTCLDGSCMMKGRCCDGCACGVLSADDQYPFINETININCIVEEKYRSAINFTDVHFTREPDYDVRLNGTFILVDNWTAVLQHTVSADDHRQNFYCETKNKLIGQRELFVEYVPRKIEDFSCIFDHLSILSCKWKHPVQYIVPQDQRVTFEWRADNRAFNKCKHHDLTWTSCGNIRENIRGDNVDIRINVTNIRKNVTTTTVIAPIKYPNSLKNLYGKPYKMEKFRVKERSRSSVKLGWYSKRREGFFVIKFNTSSGPQTVTTNEAQVLIKNLTAYTTYKFEITGYYVDISRSRIKERVPVGLPSDPVLLIARTSQDVAASPPGVTKGGFMIKPMRSTNKRNITVYWQTFKAMATYGPIVKYEVIFKTSDGRRITYPIKDMTQYHYTLTHISNDISGNVTIKAGTEVGMSAPSSPIYIPSMSELTALLDVLVVNFNNNEMSVSWAVPSQNIKVTGYTVYWCENSLGCQKEIKLTQVPADSVSYTIKNLDMKNDYLYGVSMETADMSSGFTWKDCYFVRDIEPSPPDTVMIHSRDQYSVQVTWHKPGCRGIAPVLSYYILYWCPVDSEAGNCTQAADSVKIPTSNTTETSMTYKLDNLESGVNYAAWLQSISSIGKESLSGIKTFNITTSDDIIIQAISGDTSDNIPIIVFGIAIVLLCILTLVCIRKWLYKKIKKCCDPVQIDTVQLKPSKPNVEHIPHMDELGEREQEDMTFSGAAACPSENLTYMDRTETPERAHSYFNIEDIVDGHTCSSVDNETSDASPETRRLLSALVKGRKIQEEFEMTSISCSNPDHLMEDDTGSQSSKCNGIISPEDYVRYTESECRKPVWSADIYVPNTFPCPNNDGTENDASRASKSLDSSIFSNNDDIENDLSNVSSSLDISCSNNVSQVSTSFDGLKGQVSEVNDPNKSVAHEAVPLLDSAQEHENMSSGDGYVQY